MAHSREASKTADEEGATKKVEPSYFNLPDKGQIFLLLICRLTEPVAYASISPYLYFMIRDFGYDDPSTISALAVFVTACFPLGQALTAVFWGRFSDNRGRKPALLLGLVGTGVSIMIFGFAHNIYWAVAGRLLSGMLNGNVGIMRTMIAEIVADKREYQTRAFALLPMTMNIGTILGPMIGGLLSNPTESFPGLFGGNKLFEKYPYLLPNLFPLPLILIGSISTFLFIKETSTNPNVLFPVYKDYGLKMGKWLKKAISWRRSSSSHNYEPLSGHEDELTAEISHDSTEDDNRESGEMLNLPDYETNGDQGVESQRRPISPKVDLDQTQPTIQTVEQQPSILGTSIPTIDKKKKPSLREILAHKPVKTTLILYSILMLHCPTFIQMFPLFLSTPRAADSGLKDDKTFLMFNGGLGLPSAKIGMVMSILGVIGITLQLFVYPSLASYLGNARIHQVSLVVFPPAYIMIPYLSLIPEKLQALLYICTLSLAGLVYMARTFAVPPMVVLITNASPSREVLGTVHGLTHSVVSISRCLGPFILGNLYSLGIRIGMIGLAWWVMAVIVVVENFLAVQLKEWGSLNEADEEAAVVITA